MIVNKIEEYDELVQRMNREAYLSTPIFRDALRHSFDNDLLCVGYTFTNGDTYVVSISHRDAPTFNLPIQTKFAYSTNTRILNGIDVEVLQYLKGNTITNILNYAPTYVNEVHNYFRSVKDCNRIVPIAIWASMIKKLHSVLLTTLDITQQDVYDFMHTATQTLYRIERVGLKVDIELFNQFFHKRPNEYGVVYTEYNPFTVTGRPSNRFGGVNYAALNKSDGSRAAFISRFDGGKLIQLDFESYHLRLIGHYTNLDLPKTSLHHYLATQYFEKDNISHEEYEEGKKITFGILYGDEVETDIPLLQQIKRLSTDIYRTYQKKGELHAPISNRRIFIEEGASENKVFNYFVQSLEFEATILQLKALLDYLDRKKSKLILYTYDAVLMDCHPDEQQDVIHASKELLSFNVVSQKTNAFPLKLYVGNDYDSLQLV